MTAPVTASERDLCALAGIVSQDRPDLPEAGLPASLLADLMGQIRCDEVFFVGMDSERRETWFEQEVPATDTPGREDLDRVHWQQFWHCQPCSYPDRSGDLRSVVKIDDFYSARQWHSTGMYHDHYRPYGIEHELQLCLPGLPGQGAGHGRTIRLYFFRGPGQPDFSERDRALLTLLRPHLHQAYLDAERRRHPVPHLTPRQTNLLHLVAAGHTNTQIARQLGLSQATVRTHLENIYARLQVSSRTAAVTRAFPHQVASLPQTAMSSLIDFPAAGNRRSMPWLARSKNAAPRHDRRRFSAFPAGVTRAMEDPALRAAYRGGRDGRVPGSVDVEAAECEHGRGQGAHAGHDQDRIVAKADALVDLAVPDRPVEQ
jgi:DNA-binding CsgD family transcriptional regulator